MSLLLVGGSTAALQHRRPASAPPLRAPRLVLRALRGGATDDFIWVRNGTDGPLQLVRSLSAFCAENDLEEEAMLAVSRGEADEHEGWTCGVPLVHEAPSKKKPAVKAVEVNEDDEDDSTTVEDVDVDAEEAEEAEEGASSPAVPAGPAGGMSKMLIGMLAPMGVLQVLKAYDPKSPIFLTYLRGCFFALIALNLAVQFLLDWRIGSTNDQTKVEKPPNPLAMIMGGGAGSDTQSAAEYDKSQLNSKRNSYRMGCLFTCFLHFKMKMWQPLVYSSVSGVIDLAYDPLVQIHLLGRKAEGSFARPFGGASPLGPNPLAGKAGAGSPGGGLAALLNASLGGAAPAEPSN